MTTTPNEYTDVQSPMTRQELHQELQNGVSLIIDEDIGELNRHQRKAFEKLGLKMAKIAMNKLKFDAIADDIEAQYDFYLDFMTGTRAALEEALSQSPHR
jgi:hypothetical protein